MKFKKVSITLAALTLSVQAAAITKLDENLVKETNQQKQVHKVSQPDFGMYKVEKSLALVPATIAAEDAVIEKRGNDVVIKLEKQNDVVYPGSLVRNIFTGNLAPVSGKISVLLAEGVTAQDVAAQTGLNLVSSFVGTGLAVVAVASDQDVLDASKQLRKSGLVKEARIEVLEARHTAR